MPSPWSCWGGSDSERLPEQGGGGSVCTVSPACAPSSCQQGVVGDNGGGGGAGATPGRGPEWVRQGEKTAVAPDTS